MLYSLSIFNNSTLNAENLIILDYQIAMNMENYNVIPKNNKGNKLSKFLFKFNLEINEMK